MYREPPEVIGHVDSRQEREAHILLAQLNTLFQVENHGHMCLEISKNLLGLDFGWMGDIAPRRMPRPVHPGFSQYGPKWASQMVGYGQTDSHVGNNRDSTMCGAQSHTRSHTGSPFQSGLIAMSHTLEGTLRSSDGDTIPVKGEDPGQGAQGSSPSEDETRANGATDDLDAGLRPPGRQGQMLFVHLQSESENVSEGSQMEDSRLAPPIPGLKRKRNEVVKDKEIHLSSSDRRLSTASKLGSNPDYHSATKRMGARQLSGAFQKWSDFPQELHSELAKHLYRDDVMNLRLVCHALNAAMSPVFFASVVVPFGRGMYHVDPASWDWDPLVGSVFDVHGIHIRKFGISFELDTTVMANAQAKPVSNEQRSFWGNYTWPRPDYSRFSDLQDLEKLAENVSLLKSAMARLINTHQLGLFIDSGHGWLNGPDISDMAVYDKRCGKVSRVFGQNFPLESPERRRLRDWLFRHAQELTLQDCIAAIQRYHKIFTASDAEALSSFAIRGLENFTDVEDQPDFAPLGHIGGDEETHEDAVHNHPVFITNPTIQGLANLPAPTVATTNGTLAQAPQLVLAQLCRSASSQPEANLELGASHLAADEATDLDPEGVMRCFFEADVPQAQREHYLGSLHSALLLALQAQVKLAEARRDGHKIESDYPSRTSITPGLRNDTGGAEQREIRQPQYPLIFSGWNLAAAAGGWCHLIQRQVSEPASCPLKAGALNESQAQWLLETAWAQRAFLSAYTTSILVHRDLFTQVHSLHIGKISSGLLPSLEQREFWRALPALTDLTMLVSPDWRIEHIPGDQRCNVSMLVSPAEASVEFTAFLRNYIAPIEQLSNLTIGFVGGGEHATGIKARNQHVLPAPISSAPRTWLSDHTKKANPRTILSLSHIKHLTVRNAWFSPRMLEAFIIKARDSSLRTLTLDSVSLTAAHGQRSGQALTNAAGCLQGTFPAAMWLHETLPTAHCWPAMIDRITPGVTLLDLKHQAGMAGDVSDIYQPRRSFRGFASELVFQSCGYVHISGIPVKEFNQNDLVYPTYDPVDQGLRLRSALLSESGATMSKQDPRTGTDWPLLGKLTQCIHPVEKGVLEQAWDMKFGWGDTLDRWAAVEDGCLEGGTGRFSGRVTGVDREGMDAEGE